MHYKSHRDYFNSIFFAVCFITSYVILGIAAATPGFLLAFTIPLFFLYPRNRKMLNLFMCMIIGLFLLYIISQYLNYLFNVQLSSDLVLITKDDLNPLFRVSHLTQNLYLLPGFLTFTYLVFNFNDASIKYVKLGLKVLIVIGMVEWIFFLFLGIRLDFLSNRTFGDEGSGSLFQVMNIAGINMLRFKSLTGEPSMYSFSVAPFLSLFFYRKDYLFSLLIFLSLLLSTSSTAIVGILLILILFILDNSKETIKVMKIKKSFLYILCSIGILIIPLLPILASLSVEFFSRINLQNHSGIVRFFLFYNHFNYWSDLSFFSKLFGIGFGTIRSTDMFTTLLVNTGLIGISFYSFLFFYPMFKLKKSEKNTGLKIGLMVLYITSMISVSEFSYLSLWIFLGIAHNRILIEKRMQ